MTRAPFAVALFVAVALVQAAPVPKAKKVAPHPFEVGTKWEYVVNGDPKRVTTDEITSSEEKDGVRVIRIDTTDHSGDKTFAILEFDGEQLRLTRDNGREVKPPHVIWKAGTREGDGWTDEYNSCVNATKSTTVAGKAQEITTLAGTYTAIPLTRTYAPPSGWPATVTWFSEGVGIVCFARKEAKTMDLELKSFTPGKDKK